MPTCEQCSSAIVAIVIQRMRQPPSMWKTIWQRDGKFRQNQTNSCWICAKLVDWLEVEHQELFEICRTRTLRLGFAAESFMIIGTEMPLLDIFLNISIEGQIEGEECFQCSLYLAPVQAFPPIASNLFAQRTIDSNLAVAREWIDRCQKHHTLCNNGAQMWYPTRLLHIDHQTKKVRLIISKTAHPKGPYVSLSHRWENPMPVTLQSSTITEMETEVITSSLSQAFQDAIVITHRLGISYIWIDALCIKQDKDELDWKVESQYMDKVYSNAFLNLSATKSFIGTEPLLSERCIDFLDLTKITLFDSTQKDYYIVDSQIWQDEIEDGPLNQRGWVFQERFLARRILHFGSRQLAWECHELEALELFPKGLHDYSMVLSMSKFRLYRSLCPPQKESSETWMKDFTHDYQVLVRNYSKCNLTRAKDKLIAFSGILKRIQESTEDFHVAGIWNRTLPFDLNWYCDLIERNDIPASEEPFRGPSWSWASAIGGVEFPPQADSAQQIFVANWRFSQPRTINSDPFTDRSMIILEGYHFPVRMEWSGDGVTAFRISEVQYGDNEEMMTMTPGGPDIDLDGRSETVQAMGLNEEVFWMPLFATKQAIHGLLLGKVSRRLKFRRLGRVQVPLLGEFDRLKKQVTQDLELSRSMRNTRNRREVPEEVESESNREDPRGLRFIEMMNSECRLEITLI